MGSGVFAFIFCWFPLPWLGLSDQQLSLPFLLVPFSIQIGTKPFKINLPDSSQPRRRYCHGRHGYSILKQMRKCYRTRLIFSFNDSDEDFLDHFYNQRWDNGQPDYTLTMPSLLHISILSPLFLSSNIYYYSKIILESLDPFICSLPSVVQHCVNLTLLHSISPLVIWCIEMND